MKFFLKRVYREIICKDKNGWEVKVMFIFIFSIRYLKDYFLEVLRRIFGDKINVDDIDFVFMVLVIWSVIIKVFM